MTQILASSLRRVLFAAATFTVATTHAGVTITPVYDTSFTLQPNFATLQATVNNAIAIYASNMGDNLTLAINFKFDPLIGGAQSEYASVNFSYTDYRNALVLKATTANDAIVLANLPAGPTDPVIGGANVAVPQALGLALGLSGVQANYGTVSFNTATYASNPAGFLGVIQHEIDEVLGTGSNLPNNVNGILPGPGGGTAILPTTIAPADLFRYATNGARSFTLNVANDPANKAFLRLSSGGPNQQEFNNLANGGDYGDWHTGADRLFAVAPQDQSGDSTTFTSMAISPAELILLDAVGYNAFPVPEPGTVASLSLVAFGWLAMRRRERVVRC